MAQDLEKMIQAALREIETTLDSKRVVGEPLEVGDYTLIPLVSIGFGFGVGSGSGKSEDLMKGEGTGGASAGGGGIKPIGVVVIGPEGVKVEPLKGTAASLVESLAATALRARNKLEADGD
jgi:uncharacterized spore protein YtfJ